MVDATEPSTSTIEPATSMPTVTDPNPTPIMSDALKAKAEKAAADKAVADKVLADQEHGAKVLGDMEAGIRNRLVKMSEEFGGEYAKLHTSYTEQPDEVKAHTMYKPLGDRISTVEALVNTLWHTAASFPVPVDPPVPHGSL
jgi:hypothetical protein